MARLKVTDDDYDMLTEEERIGLKEYQAELDAEMAAEDAEIAAAASGEPEAAAAKPPAKEEPEEEPEAEEEADEEEAPEEPQPEAEPEAEEEPPAEPEESQIPTGEEVEEEEEETPPIAAATSGPIYKISPSEEARLGEIKKQLKLLAQQFDDGELTAVEWRDKQEVLEDERDVLKEKKAVAAMSGQAAVTTWYNVTIPMFMGLHPEYVEGNLRHKLLDTIVRELQMASNNPTDPTILTTAHTRITKELGGVEPVTPKPKKKVNGKGNDHRPDMPPKFSDIPASDQTEVVVPNKFARLEKLRGADYERALARLSVADRELYLQGG